VAVGGVELRELNAHVLVHQRPDLSLVGEAVEAGRDLADLEGQPGQGGRALGGDGREPVDQHVLLLRGQVAPEPIVEHADAPVRQDEHVAGVGVAVEEAVLEGLLEGRLHEPVSERLLVVGRVVLDRRDLDPVEEGHGEDLGGAELDDRLRDLEELGAPGEVAPGPLHVLALVDEVELFGDRPLELLDDGGGGVGRDLLDGPLEQAAEPVEEAQVAAHGLLDPGPLNLAHHLDLGAVPEDGRAVDLRDAGGGQGLGVEADEGLVEGAA
jgi:hypothetical protein